MKKIFIYMSFLFLITACNFDILGTPDSSSYLRDKHGGIVLGCKGGGIPKDFAADFWERNNLPRGTTEFVCVNGKAYLPGKEPK